MKSGILNFAVLLSSVNFVSALKCWTTAFGEVVTMADPSAKITSQECYFPNDKSCMKHWYTITSDGPAFYELGCSDKPPAAELITGKGTGEDGIYFCNSFDWCNSAISGHPSTILIIIVSLYFVLF